MADASTVRPPGEDFGWVDEALCAALCHGDITLTPRQLVIANDLDARLGAHGSRAVVSAAELAIVREIQRKIERIGR